ncbi:rhomboid family intramembrane serine protease [Saccharothrix violaceirubra]|uniref:Membrane associated rhomboid family serine protease n=1 Tax=Saccharothrix violaceirubra TaxID=413306 RepID=A0A7W7TCK1_9PSEU|nr:rhomboid family intramembrane serine protease [Saccharothrix violaceirubra]MBB4969270.1 membrane associated rhomboid family serine protease [Saccharothrix violaceirubra]
MATPPNHPRPGDPVEASLPPCSRHPDRATGLRCTRCERPACPECLREAAVGYQCVDCVADGRRSVRRPVTFVGAEFDPRPRVTQALIAVNVLLFAGSALLAGSVARNDLSEPYQQLDLLPVAVMLGEWWRLLTSGFLHLGVTHLALNMLSLYILGRDLEPAFGRVRFLALYLTSLLGGSVAVYLFGKLNVPVVGASGAVYGLMGAMLVAVLRLKLNLVPALSVVGLNLVLSVTLPDISLLGHLGGLVIGAAVTAGFVYAPAADRARWQTLAVGGAVVLLLVMTAVRTAQLW